MDILINTEIEFLRFMYRTTLGYLLEALHEEACRKSACVIGDHHCRRQDIDLESLIRNVRDHPNMNRMIWGHAKEALCVFRTEASTILEALALTNYDPAGWIMAQSDRLLWDMEQIVHHNGGPEVPELLHQAVLPHVSIPVADEFYSITGKLDEYRKFHMEDQEHIRRAVALWPPKSSLAEKVFQVQIPNFRRLFQRPPSPI